MAPLASTSATPRFQFQFHLERHPNIASIIPGCCGHRLQIEALSRVCISGGRQILRVLRPRGRLISTVKVKTLSFLGWFGLGRYDTIPLFCHFLD